jgi:uncharacterized protein involved in response to NO
LIVSTWGFIVPMVWGFSARWLPVFMGLRPLQKSFLLVALGLNIAGVILGFLEYFVAAGILLLAGAATAVAAIRFFEPAVKPAKTVNVHRSFPVFIRIAYGWLLIAAVLSIWAALAGEAPGIWGASRHALTVGFIAAMIFCVGQRILPSFCGMRVLWSPRLMLVMLVLLMTGCTLRVASEILAYQDYAKWAWNVLPISALIELTAVALFAVNLIVTFARPPVVVTSALTMTTE